MSGGSWDYVYRHFEETSDRLGRDADPLRRALGERVALMAAAMRAVEWRDSGDTSEDAEEIRAALGDSADADVLRFLTADARRAGT